MCLLLHELRSLRKIKEKICTVSPLIGHENMKKKCGCYIYLQAYLSSNLTEKEENHYDQSVVWLTLSRLSVIPKLKSQNLKLLEINWLFNTILFFCSNSIRSDHVFILYLFTLSHPTHVVILFQFTCWAGCE